MKPQSRKDALVRNHKTVNKQESSGTDEDHHNIQAPKARPRRRVRRKRSSLQTSVYRSKDEPRLSISVDPAQSDRALSQCSNCHDIYDDSILHHHQKRNIKISVRPMGQKEPEGKIITETCHKGMEMRGYRPVGQDERHFRDYSESQCEPRRDASVCRDRIYRPVKERNCKVDDDFISKLEDRCEEDRKRASDFECRKFCNGNSDRESHFHFSKHDEEQQTMHCYEKPRNDIPTRRNEIKVFPAGNNPTDFKFVVRERKDEEATMCEESDEKHLFPFQKTQTGLLKIDPAMICYEDRKMCLLVADHTKVRVQFKSTLKASGDRKFPFKTKDPGKYSDVDEQNKSDCHPVIQRYENVRSRLL